MSANSFTKMSDQNTMSTKYVSAKTRVSTKLGTTKLYRDQIWIDQMGFGQIVQHDLRRF